MLTYCYGIVHINILFQAFFTAPQHIFILHLLPNMISIIYCAIIMGTSKNRFHQ
jgi:hypothetical protein